MGGGAFYEGLPHPHPTTSYWQSPPHDLANHRSSKDLPKAVEYVIVGSGITGATIATKLLEQRPRSSIVMLEARTACSGATGRNGGHCRAGFWTRFKSFLSSYGPEEALKLEKFEQDNIKGVIEHIRSYNIPCDLTPVETADVWTTEAEFDDALENLRERDKLCAAALGEDVIADHKIYTGQDARDYFQMPSIAGGVTFKAYTLWPYKFVCSLLERAIAKGLNLQTTTPVLSVTRTTTSPVSYPWLVETERGSVLASHVILATNAYTGALCNSVATVITPTRGQIVAIKPGSNIRNNPALQRSTGLIGNGLEDYMLSRPEGLQGAGDIIYGGGRKLSSTGEQHTFDDSVVNPKIGDYLINAAPGYFGREAWGSNGSTVNHWTGIMGYTPDGLPLVGEVTSGLWICAGFNGHGMALTFSSAKALVEMMLTRRVPNWFPRSMRLERVLNEKSA